MFEHSFSGAGVGWFHHLRLHRVRWPAPVFWNGFFHDMNLGFRCPPAHIFHLILSG